MTRNEDFKYVDDNFSDELALTNTLDHVPRRVMIFLH